MFVLPALLARNMNGQASVTYRLVYACPNNLLLLFIVISYNAHYPSLLLSEQMYCVE